MNQLWLLVFVETRPVQIELREGFHMHYKCGRSFSRLSQSLVLGYNEGAGLGEGYRFRV